MEAVTEADHRLRVQPPDDLLQAVEGGAWTGAGWTGVVAVTVALLLVTGLLSLCLRATRSLLP